jgi:hypothetical protein
LRKAAPVMIQSAKIGRAERPLGKRAVKTSSSCHIN